MKRLSILGSTGSIGTQALETCEKNGWEIAALAAGRNVKIAEAQARKFKPQFVAMFDKAAAAELKVKLADTDIKVYSGRAYAYPTCCPQNKRLRRTRLKS